MLRYRNDPEPTAVYVELVGAAFKTLMPAAMMAAKEMGESVRSSSVWYDRPNRLDALRVTISISMRLDGGAVVSALRATVRPPETLVL